MDLFSSYVPIDRRHALVSGRALPDRAAGAALFADISGFTPLTETFAQLLGPRRGAEEMVGHLNTVYTALVAQVEQVGGSVIGFSGDAITCWFDGDDGRRATACAFALQAAMRPFTALPLPNGATAPLALKVAVAAGPVRRFLVGDPTRHGIEVLAGATLDRLAAAEHLARPGEVVLDPATAAGLGDLLVAAEWRAAPDAPTRFMVARQLTREIAPQPWPPLPADALAPAQAQPWLLPPVYERLRAGQGEFLAELRPVVSLFMRFGGIDYDSDAAAGARLDQFTRWVQTVLARYAGFLNQITIGDKGSYLHASFGAPLGHGDDPIRGAAAALELVAPPPELAAIDNIRIGLAVGRAWAGACGAPTARTYTLMGDTVNLAARLMQAAAPGQILVSQPFAAAVARRYHLQALPPRQLKGKAGLVASAALRGRREGHDTNAEVPLLAHLIAPAPPLVGRAAECDLIRQQLKQLAEAQAGGVILIEGEAGIGKSRLVGALLTEAQEGGARPLVGGGDAIEQAKPYHAWQAVFRPVLGLDPWPEDAAARRAQAEAHLAADPALARLAPLLNAVLPLDLPETELTAQMSGQVRADNTRDLLLGLLRGAIEAAPAVVVLDDAQWLDSASWALALAAGQQALPLLLVLATRPLIDPAPPEYRRLREEATTRRIELTSLAPDEAVQVVCQRLGVAEVPPAVAGLIREKAEGHPFFAEELAYALRDAGRIVIEGEVCRLGLDEADLRALDFPDTVQGLIISRIDRLNSAQQLTIKVASVIGRVFGFQLLDSIYPVPGDRPRLGDNLAVLERLDLTPLEVPPPDPAYIFKHIITRDVAYNLMLFAQRRELHRAVAAWYEERYVGELEAHYALLAYHWGLAEDRAKTLEYLEKAGAQALYNGAYQETVGYLNEAVRLGPDVVGLRRARWERQLGTAYFALGEAGRARPHLEAALAQLGEQVPQTQRAWGGQLLRQVGRQMRHRLRGVQANGHAPGPTAQEQEQWLEKARAYEELGSLTYMNGEELPSIYATVAALNTAERMGPSPQLARAYARVCAAAGFVPVHRLAHLYRRRAQETVRPLTDLPATADVAAITNMYMLQISELSTARQGLEEAVAIAEQLGDRLHWMEYSALLAWATYRAGDFRRAAAIYAAMYEAGRRYGDIQGQVWGLAGQMHNALRLGDLAATRRWQDELTRLLELDLTRGLACWASGVIGLAHLYRGEPESAQQYAARTLDMIAQSGVSSAPETRVYVSEIYLGLWEAAPSTATAARAELARQAQAACRALHTLARVYPVYGPAAALQQGRLAWLHGQPAPARRHWDHALRRAEALGLPYEEGQAHYELGRHASGPARADHLARAGAIFTRLDAATDLSRTRLAGG